MKTVELKELSHLLRHKEEWPEGFVWNYSRKDSCAAGLADQKFNLQLREWEDGTDIYWQELAAAFDISAIVVEEIFIQAARGTHFSMRKVTPEMVADIIDAL